MGLSVILKVGQGAGRRFCLLALLCAVGAIVPLYYQGLTPLGFRDFADFWIAGRAVLAGVNPSDPQAFHAFAQNAFGGDYAYNWPYPPPMLVAAVPASLLPYPIAFFVWNAVTLALFYYASRPFLPPRLRVLAVLSPAAILTVIFGQTGFLVGALWFVAFRFSAAAALLIIKPHMGALAGFRTLANPKELVLGVGLLLAVCLISGLLFGGWSDFFANTTQARALLTGSNVTWVLVETAPGVGYGVYGWLFFAAAASLLLWRDFNVWTAATATMLISPYGYHYDMTVICAGLLLFLYKRDDLPAWQVAILVLAFLSPAYVRVIGTWFVPPVLLAALAIQTSPRSCSQIDDAAVGRIGAAGGRGIERPV